MGDSHCCDDALHFSFCLVGSSGEGQWGREIDSYPFRRISNPAASVLCVSVILPVLRDMPQGSKYPRAMLLGIAYAGNVGGMTVCRGVEHVSDTLDD